MSKLINISHPFLTAVLCFLMGLGAHELSTLPERRALIESFSNLNRAVADCDRDMMNNVLADQVYWNSAVYREVIGRDEFINRLCIHNRDPGLVEIEAVSVEINGDEGVVKFRSTVRRVSQDGEEFLGRFDEKIYFQKQAGTWRAITFYNRPVETGPGDLERLLDLIVTLFS